MSDDFFEEPPGPRRDRFGRPLIVPPEGGEPVPYTRASSMANYIVNHAGLHKWQQRLLAKGMGERPDLCAMASALHPITDDPKFDRITNAQLDEIINLALEQAGVHEDAHHGTAVHGFAEPRCHGPVPERMRADVDSYKAKLAAEGFTVVASECFVVNDTLQAAGTFDSLLYRPDYGIVTEDIKTGRYNAWEFAVQLAVYAGGCFYDPVTDTRSPMPDGFNRDVGIVAHIPRWQGRTDLYELDLRSGRAAAEHAAWIRTWRTQNLSRPLPSRVDEAKALIAAATTSVEMSALYQLFSAVWTDELTRLGNERLASLASSE